SDSTETLIEIRAPFDGTIVYRAPFVNGDKVDADAPVLVVAGGETYLSGDYIYEANLKGNVQFFAYIDGKKTQLEKYPYTALDYSMRRARFGLGGTHVETGSCIGVFVESVLKEKALCIPVDALKADKEGFYCFVLEDGKQVKKRVRTGIVTDLVAEITEGLKENETVIVSTVSRDSAGTKTSTAKYETFSNDNNYVGTTEYNNTTLYFENEGIMFSKFLVNEGQQVKKGDPIAECETIVSGKAIEDIEKEIERLTEKIDSFTASAEASRALILKNAESLPASEKRLTELKLIRTETELKRDTDGLKKEKDKLEKELKSLMGQIMTEILYAPMDGVIDKLAYISEGTEITGTRWIAMMHSEEEEYIAITDTDMTVNAGVRVAVRANGNEYYDGTVVQSDSVLSGKGRTGKAYVLLDDKNVVLSRLQNVSVVVRKPVIEHVLTVPRSALMTSGDREYVLIARDGVCKKRYVTTGPSNGEFYCILNGISEGDTVVTQ
ncbi:MAG: hypothetical protein J6Z46_02410, partial [Lachnospiraceae bacterium]|nr:hypothetical protein [Lachnospiraceae bacterium]